MHDVQARAVVELGVLEAFGRVELAMAARRAVEHLGERAHDVIVVLEHLVVVAAHAAVALDEDLIRAVDHDLPDVVVIEQRGQGAEAREVAEDPLGESRGVRQRMRAQAAADLVVPRHDLVVDQLAEPLLAVGAAHVEGQHLGSCLHGPLDLDEGRLVAMRRRGGGQGSAAPSDRSWRSDRTGRRRRDRDDIFHRNRRRPRTNVPDELTRKYCAAPRGKDPNRE